MAARIQQATDFDLPAGRCPEKSLDFNFHKPQLWSTIANRHTLRVGMRSERRDGEWTESVFRHVDGSMGNRVGEGWTQVSFSVFR
jgi:hypothetical protein